jgi:hypothetical protein
MQNNKQKMWQSPWRYRESIAVVSGVIAVGWLLQFTVGEFDFRLMRFPVNLIAGGVLVSLILLLTFARKTALCRWLSGIPMAVTLTSALVVMGIIMGLTPQVFLGAEPHGDLPSKLGWDNMTSSWPFVLIYILTLLSLGMLIARRLIPFRWRDYAFYLNHIGLWLFLFAAGFGAADMKRYVMHVREGETEWRVYNDNGDILDLPIAIELNDFDMEEYPPKLAVIDKETGTAQPEDKPQFFQIDEKMTIGRIANWEINLEEYIHDAIRNSDSTYREMPMPGASPAARILVKDIKTGNIHEGWVCAGNMAQMYMTLDLNEHYAVVATKPEPKRFVSDINVYTENGQKAHALLEVNKPLKVGHWMLYQYDYEKDAGRMSTYSSIELVYDPWIVPVYASMILLMAGSVCMLWAGNRGKEEENDVE